MGNILRHTIALQFTALLWSGLDTSKTWASDVCPPGGLHLKLVKLSEEFTPTQTKRIKDDRGAPIHEFISNKEQNQFVVSKNGRYGIYNDRSGNQLTVKMIDHQNPKIVREVEFETLWDIQQVSNDGKYFTSSFADNLSIHEAKTGRVLFNQKSTTQNRPIHSHFSDDSRFLTISYTNRIEVVDLEAPGIIATYQTKKDLLGPAMYFEETQSVVAMALEKQHPGYWFKNEGGQLVPQRAVDFPFDHPKAVHPAPKSPQVESVSQIKLRKQIQKQKANLKNPHKFYLGDASNGHLLVVRINEVTSTQSLDIYSTFTQKYLRTFHLKRTFPTGVAVSGDRKLVGTVSHRTIKVFDIADPDQPLLIMDSPAGNAARISFTEDGRLIVGGSNGSYQWNLSDLID